MPQYRVEFLDEAESNLLSVSEQKAVELTIQPQVQYQVEIDAESVAILSGNDTAYGVEFVDRKAILL